MGKRKLEGISARITEIFALLLIPMYLFLVISAYSYRNALQEQAAQSAEAIFELNLNTLEKEIKQIDYFFYALREDDTNYQALYDWSGSGAQSIASYSLVRTLQEENANLDVSNLLFFYIAEGEQVYVVSEEYSDAEREKIGEALIQYGLASENSLWHLAQLNGISYYVHTIGYDGVYLGALIDLDMIAGQIEDQIGFEYAQVQVQVQVRGEGENLESEERNSVVVSEEIQSSAVELAVVLNKAKMAATIPILSQMLFYISIAFVIVIPLLWWIMHRMVVKPLKEIEDGLRKLGAGEQDFRMPVQGGAPEFQSVRNSFNAMADEIRDLKIESYEKQLEKEKMRLQNILLQIRPHFILNFMNQIYSLAQLKDFEGIQKMSLYLSKFFRHLFHGEELVPLKSEFALVADYLKMMELRYLDCFSVEWNVDEELLDCKVPPLLVHNFVENIFKYAVDEEMETLIRISLYREKKETVIMIEDDGPGMEPEILKKIQSSEVVDKADGTHIGIWNSGYRLKTFCGEKSRLIVDSVLTEGTRVQIYLPMNNEEESENA